MITYVNENDNGRTLHLLRIDGMSDGVVSYLDATRVVKDAEHDDIKAGYKHGGPRMGCEIEHAREYAKYVEKHATAENLHYFYCSNYYLFTNRAN